MIPLQRPARAVSFSLAWAICLTCFDPAHATVTPFAHFRMGDDTPPTQGGRNLPRDSSGQGRHMTGAGAGTPVIQAQGGPTGDAFYRFNGSSDYFFGTATAWDPPEDDVGVEAWVRTSNVTQTNRHIFGTAANTSGLNLGFEAGGGAGWFGAVANKAFAGTSGLGSYTAGTWIHLAVVRAGGVATFYVNGVPMGQNSSIPYPASGQGALHMGVTSGATAMFEGDIAEARIFTFTPGAFDPANDLLIKPATPVLVHEASFDTRAGATYLACFEVQSKGNAAPPRMLLDIAGQSNLRSATLLEKPPQGTSGVPYTIRFTADSARTTLRFTTLMGDPAESGTITALRVEEPVAAIPSTRPNSRQRAQIDRRYGMFIHFGINTFHNEEWTDGTKPAFSYQPTNLDVEQWVRTAYEAGMRYVLLITKHHDGFCLWDSPWTTYDVASSSVPNDVIAAAAAACRKYGISLALYYSLWDRHEPSYSNDDAYNQYMLRQLSELLGKNGPICELWLDGGWDKSRDRWPSLEIHDLVRRLQPDCQVSTNWTIGAPGNPDQALVLPTDQREGHPFRYFPSDFRLGDPYLPTFPDPKVFSDNGKSYYLPFESTVTLSSQNRWFHNTQDPANKPISQLAGIYYAATAQDNILVLNSPPDRSGRMRDTERTTLLKLRDKLGLAPGMRLPRNVTGTPTASASSVWENDVATYGPARALDGNPETRWASGPAGSTSASLELDFGSPRAISRVLIDEFEPNAGTGRIRSFQLQSWENGTWKTFHAGTACGRFSLHDFPQRSVSRLRLQVDSATDAVSLWEFQAHDAAHAFSAWRDRHFPVDGTSNPSHGWNGDPDGDGRHNLLEFALGSDPSQPGPSAAGLVATPAETNGSDFALTFTFPARDGAVFSGTPLRSTAIDGVVYQVECGTTPTDFSAPVVETEVTSTTLPALSHGWSYRAFRHAPPAPARAFFRVLATPDTSAANGAP